MRHMEVVGRLLVALSACSLFSSLSAAQPEKPVTKKGEYRLLPGDSLEARAHADQKRQELKDPEARKALQASQRAHLKSLYPDIAEVLDLDAVLYQKLFDLLTAHTMAGLDRFFNSKHEPASLESITAHKAGEARDKQQLLELLGEERYVRFLDYQQESPARGQLAYFEKHLEARDKLAPEQRERLLALLKADFEATMERDRQAMRNRPHTFQPGDLQTMNVRANEDGFRRMKENSEQLLKKVPEILTPAQLQVFERLETQKITGQRKHVQKLRTAAGMRAEFDEAAQKPLDSTRELQTGQVRVEISLRINNGEPVKKSFVAENGKASEIFEGSAGLWFEATPSLLDDGWSYVDFRFYETVNGQRRRLPGMLGTGSPPDRGNLPAGMMGSGISTVSGLKMYEIFMQARVTAM